MSRLEEGGRVDPASIQSPYERALLARHIFAYCWVTGHFIKEGDKVPVVVKEIDDKGRINLSIKQADPNFFTKKEEVPKPFGGPRKDFKKRF